MHDSFILDSKSSLIQGLGWQCSSRYAYGVSPDISILLLYKFYQPVFYATQNQSYPSVSEERAAHWVGFGEHVGDALTHKLLDDDTKKILRDWYQMEGRAPRPPNPLSLSGLVKMIVNLLPNPWQNITLMTSLVGPSYSQRMNMEKRLEPLSRGKS